MTNSAVHNFITLIQISTEIGCASSTAPNGMAKTRESMVHVITPWVVTQGRSDHDRSFDSANS